MSKKNSRGTLSPFRSREYCNPFVHKCIVIMVVLCIKCKWCFFLHGKIYRVRFRMDLIEDRCSYNIIVVYVYRLIIKAVMYVK